MVAVVGGLLVLAAAISVVGTLIVPRPVGSWLTRLVDKAVNGGFRIATAPIKSYRRRDRVFAAEAAVLLLAQLAAWLIVFYVAGSSIPLMSALGNWNILIGMGGMAAAFGIPTLWR